MLCGCFPTLHKIDGIKRKKKCLGCFEATTDDLSQEVEVRATVGLPNGRRPQENLQISYKVA